MSAYGTNLAEGFASKVMQRHFERSVAEVITNQDYEGEIKDTLSKLNILTFGALTLRNYTGADVIWEDPTESVGTLTTDQQKYIAFKIKSLDRFKSWIKNPEGTLLEYWANQLKETVDAYVLGLYGDVASGNRVGTDYTTGTVEIANTTGVVTGSGTTFTSAMVGRGFKATGHTKWYRVKTFTSTTEIVIENDSDDETSSYDGGAINAGATYTIEANTAVQVTKTNIYEKIIALKTKLDQAKVPASDRFLVLPSAISNLLLQASEVTPAVDQAYEETIKRGLVGMVGGFALYQNEQVTGDSTNGYRCLAGHKSAITYALGFTESNVVELENNFGKGYKGLTVYGAKVVDERRKALAEGFFKL